MTNLPDKPTASEILIYKTEDGKTRIQVRLEDETVWLSQKMMAELFQKDVRTINEHIRNIFEEGELSSESVIRNFRITAADGKTYDTQHYNLDVIISVGYRVKSHRGTQFRIWATQRLREYIIKGFTLDDERLKQAGGGNYFDELLARIRDIRSSEKVFWRKVLDIYATSIDYDPNADISHEFFQIVQNKMHWAAHGHTAAEVIAGRADAMKPHTGLTSWTGAKPTQADSEIAKNYLTAEELDTLNRLVTIYLDFADTIGNRQSSIGDKSMLTAIRIGNFKAFAEAQRIPIRPLTLIYGANSSGKSSILHSLILARHAQETGYLDVHHTNVGGESVDLGGFRQYVHRREASRRVEWAMELDTSSFKERLAELLAPVKQVTMLLNLGIALDDQDRPLPDSIPEIHTYELLADGQSLLRMSRRRDGKLQLDRLDHEHPVFREVIKAMVLLSTTTETIHPEDFEGLDEAIAELVPEVVAKSTQFLPDGLAESTVFSPGGQARLFTISKARRKEELSAAVRSFLPRKIDELLRGVSQVLPVLVIAYASVNQIVAVEQPEIHLHPALQADMGDVFIQSALGPGKNRFLIETHSEHLLLRIMRRMRETSNGGLLDGFPNVTPNDVCVLFVEPDGSRSIVREMPLNENGELVKAWPGGFFEEGIREIF